MCILIGCIAFAFMNENAKFVITTIVNSLLTFVLWPNLFPIQFILNTRIKRYPWRIIQFSIGALKSFEPTKGTKKTSILSEGAKKTTIRRLKGTKNLNSGKKNKKKQLQWSLLKYLAREVFNSMKYKIRWCSLVIQLHNSSDIFIFNDG